MITINKPISLDLLFDWQDGKHSGRISAFLDEHANIDVNIEKLDKEFARRILYTLVDIIIDNGYYSQH